MRTFALLAASLLAFGALAGCVGGKDDDVSPNKVPDTTNLPGGGESLTVLAALKSAITADADAWIAPGATFPVAVEPPTNATGKVTGNVTYTWAIGALPGTVAGPVTELDTGVINASASKKLKYEAAGVYLMHCHPHPYMTHNVTVVEGFDGPKSVVVQIVDGKTTGEYRFVPENIVVAPGTEVTYQNVGTQPHTATLSTSEPALKALPLKEAAGDVVVEGDGWQRIVAIMQDEAGRIGIVEHPVYVKAIPANFHGEASGTFTVGTGAAPIAPPADLPGSPPSTTNMLFEHGGRAFINVTVEDPTGELNSVSVHLRKQGETQDTMTLAPGTLTADGVVNAGQHVLEVVAEQGANIAFTVTVDVVYDLVPPAPAAPAADDGHGGHAHH